MSESDLHRRVEAQVWFAPNRVAGASGRTVAKTVLDEALAAAARAARGASALRPAELVSVLDDARAALACTGLASRAAAAAARAAVADLAVLCGRIEADKAAADGCRAEIAQLEAEVAAERLAKERRATYDGIAAVALKDPARATSLSIMEDVGAECARLEVEERRLKDAQECVKKNFMLVMQSSGDLEAYAASDAFVGENGNERAEGEVIEGETDDIAGAGEDGAGDDDVERRRKRLRTGDDVHKESPDAVTADSRALDTAMKDVD